MGARVSEHGLGAHRPPSQPPQAGEALLGSHGHVINWKREAAGQCLSTTTPPGEQAPLLCLWGPGPPSLLAAQQSLGVRASPSAGPGRRHGWGTRDGSEGGSRHPPPPPAVALPFAQLSRLTTTTTGESSRFLCARAQAITVGTVSACHSQCYSAASVPQQWELVVKFRRLPNPNEAPQKPTCHPLLP